VAEFYSLAAHMMRAILNIFIVASMAVWSGCIPYRFTVRTGASGAITDARTGMAVSQAIVILSSGHTPGRGPCQFSTHPDTNGMFHIAAEHTWGMLPLGPFDPARWTTKISISAPGYISFSQAYPCSPLGPSSVKLSDVRLEHEP
jgi:hypothetical protein